MKTPEFLRDQNFLTFCGALSACGIVLRLMWGTTPTAAKVAVCIGFLAAGFWLHRYRNRQAQQRQ